MIQQSIKLWGTFFILILSTKSCNNDNIEKGYYSSGSLKHEIEKNKEGKYHGNMIDYYENGDTLAIRHWNNGVQDGIEKEYYPNRNLKAIFHFVNGKLNGEILTFYENGNLETKGYFRDSLFHGELINYFNSDSLKILRITNYINFQGLEKPMGWIEYNTDGSIKSEESRVIFSPLSDTINLGDSVTVNIVLTAPKYDSTFFFIGNYDEKFFLQKPSKVDTIWAKNHQIIYRVKSSKKGKNYIRGGARNYQVLPPKDMLRREIVRPELYFEYSYFVK